MPTRRRLALCRDEAPPGIGPSAVGEPSCESRRRAIDGCRRPGGHGPRAATPGTEAEDAFWEALQSLVKATTVDEALLTARELCASPDLPSRIAGAGRCNPYTPDLARFVSSIEDVAATETDPSVLSLTLQALGHTGVERTPDDSATAVAR